MSIILTLPVQKTNDEEDGCPESCQSGFTRQCRTICHNLLRIPRST